MEEDNHMQTLEMPLLRWPVGLRRLRATFFQLAYFHFVDWFMVLVLAGAFYGFHVIHPFKCFIGKDDLDRLRYPIKSDTVPVLFIPVISVGAPVIVILVNYIYRRDARDLHHSLLGLTFSIALAGVLTNSLKDALGWPRPDFFWRCFPDGQESYTASGEVKCTGDPSLILEGRESFPSGHASWCFSGLGYLSLYLAGKFQLFDGQGHLWKIILPLIPIATATYIGITRVGDYKHHWEDVVAGAAIGLTAATLCYRQHFPSLKDVNCRETSTHMSFGEPLAAELNRGESNV